MSGTRTLEGCLELGFTLPKTLQKAISMFMELEEEQAAPHTKIGHVIYVTDKCFSVEWPLESLFCNSAPWKWPMHLQDITQLSVDQVSMGWRMLNMSSTEGNRHIQNISSPTRSWSRKPLPRLQRQQSRRPSDCPWERPEWFKPATGLQWIASNKKNQYSLNPNSQEISCLSFIKHC